MGNGVKAEIIAVGTELLLGQISNTNAQWISEQLALHGVNVFHHSVIGDNYERLTSLFSLAQDRSDLVIVTGGLGPTDDDMTREAASEILEKPIYEDAETMRNIEAYYEKNSFTMSPNNRKQARIFEGADILVNDVGMAPGMAIQKNDTLWIFLPGVPREMKAIMQHQGFPYIQQTFPNQSPIFSRMLRFIGIGESQLEHDLKDLIAAQQNPTIAPLASNGEVAIRLTAKAESEAKAKELVQVTEQQIYERVGDYVYGYDDDSIDQSVFELLKEKQFTISAAESLTGGQFVERLVTLKGASSVCNGGVVCYAKSVKENLLEVPKLIISHYGTVSEACAVSMAVNVAEKLDSNIGISFTGVAGPDEVEGHTAGTVFIGIYIDGESPFAKRFYFNGDRDMVRTKAVKKGYELLYHHLKQKNH
ncbi:competence/damage-inducible protein A [Pontibacillus marinus]|uniref:Putative competence-damage inducible protein n=1 Tax=Pontibacillus marinus BH030004 = DSM 16465 TaxID=1385511 RepID=A0A0A5FRG9_9BACI|nr:competence/damage-inducible protein A [Pontibacillus marinus]KGX83376.1 hypothetical protein N783_04315 [Pontibacillus marinus BH030004 = DSM 16465]